MEEQALYDAIMAFARKWGFTFDEAVNTIYAATNPHPCGDCIEFQTRGYPCIPEWKSCAYSEKEVK